MKMLRTNTKDFAKRQPTFGMAGGVCLLGLNASPLGFGGKLGRRATMTIDNRQVRH